MRKLLLDKLKIRSYILYALGEILLIVIGVLIAIQLNNLNQSRLDIQSERILLTNLKNYFLSNEIKIDKAIDDLMVVKKNQEIWIKLSGPNAKEPDSLFSENVNKVNYTGLNAIYGGDYEVLTAEQNLILRNNQLKFALNNFSSQYVVYKDLEEEIDALVVNAQKTHQKYISILSEDSSNVDENNLFQSDFQGMLRDREAQNIAVEIKWKTQQAIKHLNKLKDINSEILNLL